MLTPFTSGKSLLVGTRLLVVGVALTGPGEEPVPTLEGVVPVVVVVVVVPSLWSLGILGGTKGRRGGGSEVSGGFLSDIGTLLSWGGAHVGGALRVAESSCIAEFTAGEEEEKELCETILTSEAALEEEPLGWTPLPELLPAAFCPSSVASTLPLLTLLEELKALFSLIFFPTGAMEDSATPLAGCGAVAAAADVGLGFRARFKVTNELSEALGRDFAAVVCTKCCLSFLAAGGVGC